ncbi:PRAME family member 12-like [Ochotona curzoniae]|uniref:PRAME family member 12-like n=1 Tax=Ochotona curzoniae TaxID=130825 RepID=UPI001B346CF4|nr:PRAME family member 12-like [Ochotona curzoniae]
MSSMTPPRLLHLAQKSLLDNEALAILSLDQLPREMFPALLVEAFNRWLLDILRAMVRVWPFEVLPLGALMKNPQVDILKAVLDGLDMKYTQKSDCRGKLHVLDLRDAGLNFWNVWAESLDDACSSEPNMRRQPVEHKGAKSALKVIANLYLAEVTPDEFLTHLLQWVKERASLVHLCCHQLNISVNSIHRMSNILDILELGCIQEVQVNSDWRLPTLAKFAPYLGQMSSLHKLSAFHLSFPTPISLEGKVYFNTQYNSELPKLPHLQSLHMNSVDFLEDNLDQVFSELKHLHLSGVKLTHISSEPLRVLLERVAATLMTLDLMDCDITDSQLNAILPALSQCYQLTSLSFYGNRISMAMMEKLMEHTGNLSALRVELYPAPLDCYDTHGVAKRGRFFPSLYRADGHP